MMCCDTLQGMEAEGLLFPGLAAGSLLSHDLPFNLPLAPDDGISGIVSHIAPVLATEAAGTGGLLPPHAYPAPVSTGFQGPMMGPMMVPELPHPVNPDMWLATKGWPGTSAATPAVATAAAPGATAAPMHVAPGGSAPSTPATYMMGAKRHSEEQEVGFCRHVDDCIDQRWQVGAVAVRNDLFMLCVCVLWQTVFEFSYPNSGNSSMFSKFFVTLMHSCVTI